MHIHTHAHTHTWAELVSIFKLLVYWFSVRQAKLGTSRSAAPMPHDMRASERVYVLICKLNYAIRTLFRKHSNKLTANAFRFSCVCVICVAMPYNLLCVACGSQCLMVVRSGFYSGRSPLMLSVALFFHSSLSLSFYSSYDERYHLNHSVIIWLLWFIGWACLGADEWDGCSDASNWYRFGYIKLS